jgi:hypothetical protein
LKQISDADFQKLCDALLHAQGYKFIKSTGSSLGKSKTRVGTPDTLIYQNENNKYIMVEYTTQENGIYEKFSDDIRKNYLLL